MMDGKKIAEELYELCCRSCADRVMDDFYVIPMREVPKPSYGFIGDPQVTVDGVDVKDYTITQETAVHFRASALRDLVIADVIDEMVNSQKDVEDRRAIWDALLEITPSLSGSMPEDFKGIDDVGHYQKASVLKIAELKKQLTEVKRSKVIPPTEFNGRSNY